MPNPPAIRLELYDTTLRDGTQGEGFNLSLADKLAVAVKLDELGFDYIEGGFPLSNPKDAGFFAEAANVRFKHARLAAFGMTRRRGVTAAEDPGMKSLIAAATPTVTIVGKSSKYQVQVVLGVTPEENLAMISDTVAYLRSAGREVLYDAEHYFDSFAREPEYALATIEAAYKAGARVAVLCDTNGGTMPETVAAGVAAAVARLGAGAVGIHTHNDCGLAVANALAAVAKGARQVQGTINGVGERCGNMDLIVAAANLSLKFGYGMLQAGGIERLTDLSRFVYEIANVNLIPGQPYVGGSAFAHKGGMHVHAVQKDPGTYEHINPEAVGNRRKILISEMSGASNVAAKLGRKFGIEHDRDALKRVLEKVGELENAGYQFETAEASFELLVRKIIGRHSSFFDLHHYRVEIVRNGTSLAAGVDPGVVISEATVKVRVGQTVRHEVAEGTGPVGALDAALRKALLPTYPMLTRLHLADYKVRVTSSAAEADAVVRVVIEFRRELAGGAESGNFEHFGTVGVSGNVIDATWQAIVDAYEYHLLQEEAASGGAGGGQNG